jgi:hypothetical protein
MCRPNLFFVLTAVIAVGGTVCEDKGLRISRDQELSYCREVLSAIDLSANDGHTKEVYERLVDDTVTCMGRHPVPLPTATAAAAATAATTRTTATSTANGVSLSLQAWSPSLVTLAFLDPAGGDSRLQPSSATLDNLRRSVHCIIL